MFQHHSEDSQNSYDPSGDTLGDVFESSHNSTLSCPPESNEPVPIPSEKELRQPNHDARGPQEEEGQELSSNGQCVSFKLYFRIANHYCMYLCTSEQ
jgi:hypothetical protein